jgi:glycosyltransferase involved in cell wall biosynthesis
MDRDVLVSRPPRISIVVATWNAASTLDRCLGSIQSQTFEQWELLIADGGSTDGTVDLIKKWNTAITWWVSEEDAGIYDAWNKALSYARGEYVAFLGADDTLHSSSTLQDVLERIDDQPYDLVTGRGVLVDETGHPYHEFGNPYDYRRLMRRMTICHPGALHRRDLFRRFGHFNTSYQISADYEFLLRLPSDLKTLHVAFPITTIGDFGISRSARWVMLKERYRAQAACPRVGPVRAAVNYVDKLWRIPVAKVLGIPN